MMDRMIRIINKVVGVTVDASKSINIHHNYCSCETCKVYDPKNPTNFKEEQLWITRKGATSAKLGEYGIIPGSMGVGSFIVRGLGNPQSWQSCSHGAGR
jgi:tRNA-splicing ligase RtcB (3'-phosphate/5'-hydroxy nucleic acid ligase)